jgi:hypothetical protein
MLYQPVLLVGCPPAAALAKTSRVISSPCTCPKASNCGTRVRVASAVVWGQPPDVRSAGSSIRSPITSML